MKTSQALSGSSNSSLPAELTALRAENAKLREALTRIAIETSRRMATGGEKEHFQDGNRQAGDVARAALKETDRE